MVTPTLETSRVLLRPPEMPDAQTVFNNWTSDPNVAKFMRYNVHTSIDTTIEWLSYAVSKIPCDKAYDWCFILKESGTLFGAGGLYFDEEHNMFEIGFNIMKDLWGQGLVTEASKGMIKFAVEELKQTQFFGKHAKENIGSGKVLEKLGFVYQKDGEYPTLDGKQIFQSREYLLTMNQT